MNKTIKVIGLSTAAIIGTSVTALIIIGLNVPDTAGYTGLQIPKKYMTTIRSLNLITEDEQIRYFYSDAFLDIKDGLYFVTNKKLVLYSSDWEVPKIIIPFDQIATVDAMYNDSFYQDTWVFIVTFSGTEVSFPVSGEKGLDKKFVETIKEKLTVEQVAPSDD